MICPDFLGQSADEWLREMVSILWIYVFHQNLKFVLYLVVISGTHHSMLSVNFTRDCMVILALRFVAEQPAIQEMLESQNAGKWKAYFKVLVRDRLDYRRSPDSSFHK